MADYAIHEETLIAQANMIRKKFGTSDRQDPADYAKKMNLMGLLEEKTASGSIATFSDGADDVPLKSCEVTLPASLDGYSSVDMVHCGKNILNGEDAVKTANNIRFYYGNGKYYHAGTYTLSISESVSGIYVRNVSTSANIFVKYNTNFITFTLTEQTLISFDFYKVGINQDDNVMLEVGSTASTFEPYSSSVYTVNLGRTIYGGAADVVKGTGTDENGDDFTFEPVEISSRLGNNTMWSDGDMEVTYRASGTVTPVVPTLISKTIEANGTYSASDDGADGYDAVVVNVPSVEPTVTPLNSPNAFLTLSEVTGTDVERTVRTETAPSNGKYVFASDSTCRTNTGGGDGFIEIQKNGVSVVKQYMSANTTTDIAIPDIDVEAGDEVAFIVGFDNNHSSCNFQLYTGIAFVSEASAPSLLSMSPSEEVNENTEEVEENEQNESEG